MTTGLNTKDYVKCSKCGKTMIASSEKLKFNDVKSICNLCYNDMLYPSGSTARMESVDEMPYTTNRSFS